LDGPNEFNKDLNISEEALITLLKLLNPQQLKLSTYLNADVPPFSQLPFLMGMCYTAY
jgi:hypothetical protein